MIDEINRIHAACDEEGSLRRLGLRPSGDEQIQAALVPSGGDWQCYAMEGQPTRSVFFRNTEVALVNPNGDMGDGEEADVSMGITAMPVADKALRVIAILARDPSNLALIENVAWAAIGIIERPAPRIPHPDEEDEDEPPADDGPSEAEIERSQARIRDILGPSADDDGIAF